MPTFDPEEFMCPPEVPSGKDRIFASQEDWWNNACVYGRQDGWGLYARGYKEAADILCHQIEERQRLQDFVVYPIVFLYRQYLELQIKELIRLANRLLDRTTNLPLHHRIDELWRTCKPLLAEIAPNDSTAEISQIERLISEFSSVDPTSMSFRYPEDRDGNPSLSNLPHINLRNIREVMGKVSAILTGADLMLHQYLGNKQDIENCY